MIWLLSCAASWQCPAHLAPDPERAQRLGDPKICFGDVSPSVITDAGVIWLDTRLSEPAARARVAHLLHHRGIAPAPGPDCLETWIRREAEAYDLEVQARVGADLPVGYGFSWSFEEPAAERIAVIEAYLWANPQGAGGIGPLVNSYRDRCKLPP